MKRLILSGIVLIWMFSLFAATGDIVGTGYGKTADEARSAAKADLTSQISVRISSVTTLSMSDEGYGSTSALLTSFSAENSELDLIGLKWDSASPSYDSSAKQYKAVCRITDSSLATYRTKLKELAKDIELLYGMLNDESQIGTISDKKAEYLQLIILIQQFESYRYIVQYFDPESEVPALPVTRNYLEVVYQSVLQTEANRMQSNVLSLQKQMELGVLTSQGQEDLERAMEELQKTRELQSALQEQRAEELLKSREAYFQDISANLSRFEVPKTNGTSGEDSTDLISVVEAGKQAFETYKASMREELLKYNDRFIVAAKERISQIEELATETASIVEEGKEKFEQEKQAYIDSEIEALRKVYEEDLGKSYQIAVKPLNDILTDVKNSVSQLSSRKFSVVSGSPELSFVITGYSHALSGWNGKAILALGDNSIEFSFLIPLEDFVGEGSLDFMKQMEAIKRWNDLLKTYPQLCRLRATYSVNTDIEGNRYTLSIEEYCVDKLDTSTGKYSTVYSEYISKVYSFNYGTDLSTTLDFGGCYNVLKASSLFNVKFSITVKTADIILSERLDRLESGYKSMVSVSGIAMGVYEVTHSYWKDVYDWAVSNGYSFSIKRSVSVNKPVTGISWRDAIVWCNALSEKNGLTPVYYTDADYKTPLRTSTDSNEVSRNSAGTQDCPYIYALARGNIDISRCTANGYRLPTSEEWETFAKAGTSYMYSGSNIIGDVAWYRDNAYEDGTHDVGTKNPNDWGLYDMSGNVWEWCWDWGSTDSKRVARGGGWNGFASVCEISNMVNCFPYFVNGNLGFRVCRTLPKAENIQSSSAFKITPVSETSVTNGSGNAAKDVSSVADVMPDQVAMEEAFVAKTGSSAPDMTPVQETKETKPRVADKSPGIGTTLIQELKSFRFIARAGYEFNMWFPENDDGSDYSITRTMHSISASAGCLKLTGNKNIAFSLELVCDVGFGCKDTYKSDTEGSYEVPRGGSFKIGCSASCSFLMKSLPNWMQISGQLLFGQETTVNLGVNYILDDVGGISPYVGWLFDIAIGEGSAPGVKWVMGVMTPLKR